MTVRMQHVSFSPMLIRITRENEVVAWLQDDSQAIKRRGYDPHYNPWRLTVTALDDRPTSHHHNPASAMQALKRMLV